MGAPRPYRVCKKRSKIMHLRRRRISSLIYTAARHYHHGLTFKDVPERCLAGFVAVGPQLDAYEGRRWPSFSRRDGGSLSLVLAGGERSALASVGSSKYQLCVICQKNRISVMINTLCNIFFCCTTYVAQLVEVAALLSMLALGNPSPTSGLVVVER